MKRKILSEKLPELLDYALAVAISSIPGIAEADAHTKAIYKSMTKELLAHEIKSQTRFARLNLRKLTLRWKHDQLKVSA